MALLDRCNIEGSPAVDRRAAKSERDRLLLLDDAGGPVLAAVLPGDPQPEAGDDQRGQRNRLADADPASPRGFRFVHRPPASSKRRGAASSQLRAMRSAIWSQSTAAAVRF